MPIDEKEENGRGGTPTGVALDTDATVSVVCERIGKLLVNILASYGTVTPMTACCDTVSRIN